MGKEVKIDASLLADENLLMDICRELQDEGIQANENSAVVVRDAGGKVVQVRVNLPDDTPSQSIDNANARIQNNPGVAGTRTLPIEETTDFNTLTQDQAQTMFGTDETRFVLIGYSNSQWQGAAAAEAVGATGSALRCTDINPAAGTTLNGTVSGEWNAPAIAKVTGYELEYDLRISTTESGTGRDEGDEWLTGVHQFPNSIPGHPDTNGLPQIQLKQGSIFAIDSPNWHLFKGGPEVPASYVDTGILRTNNLHVSLSVKPNGDTVFTAGGANLTFAGISWFGTLVGPRMSFSHAHKNLAGTGNIGLVQPTIFDNVRYKVTDAV